MTNIDRSKVNQSLGREVLSGGSNPTPANGDEITGEENALQIRTMLEEYRVKGQNAVAILNELDTLIGPSFMPKLVNTAARFALYKDPTATAYASPPLPFVVNLIPKAISTKIELFADIINFGTELNLIPRSKLEAIADSSVESENFVNLIKESLK